jgi:tetratricopeptide (TPR) repeat protein
MTNFLQGLNAPQAIALSEQLINSGSINEAAQILSQTLAKHPGDSPLALKLARLLQQHGQQEPALKVLQHSFAHNPQNFELCYMLGAIEHISGHFESAEKATLKAIELNPNSAAAYNILGSSYVELLEHKKAEQAFKKSIKLNPKSADGHNNIAWMYRALGNKEAAIKHFEKAIKVDPLATEALSGIALLKTFKGTETEFQLIEALLQSSAIDTKQRTDLQFALGKAYEDTQNYPKAFEHFEKGNQIWRQTFDYNIDEDQAFFDQLKATFTQPYIEDALSKPSHSENVVAPIFVLGMPRSSTTLIEQILASHSQVNGGGELSYLQSLCLSAPKKLNWDTKLTKQDLEDIASRYNEKLSKHSEGVAFVTDKMPHNFTLIGAILALFPNAKIIHCRRQAMDTCLSLYKHHFPMSNHRYSYDLKELGEYYNLYEDLMAHWHHVAPGRVFDIEYESLLVNFEDDVRKMLDYCDLAFEASCLDFYKTKRLVRTASSDQVRQGLYSKAAGRWKLYGQQLDQLKASLQSYS